MCVYRKELFYYFIYFIIVIYIKATSTTPAPWLTSQMLNSLPPSEGMQSQANFSQIYSTMSPINKFLLRFRHSPGVLLLGVIVDTKPH